LSRTGTRTWPRTGDRGRNGGRLAAEDWRQKNKCGPGQPPGPHCFCEILFAPDPRTRHGGEQPSSPALRRVRAMMLLVRLSLAKRTSRTNLQHCDGTSGQSCRVWRTLEEAATPGQPVRAEARLWRNPPTIHPRELSGTAGSAAMLWQGVQESRLNVDTVRYRSLAIKRKPEHRCAETVNVRNSLWKATENETAILFN
jgi:hypothetical protein